MPDAATRTYRRRVAAIRAEVIRRLLVLYGQELDRTAIRETAKVWAERAEPVLSGGQAAVAALAEAYLVRLASQAGISISFGSTTAELAGTTVAGNTIAEAMDVLGPMILGQIGAGNPEDQAIEFGRYAIERLADRELTGVEDRLQDDPVVKTHLSGWLGTVAPDACDPCLLNAGEHELTWRPYRHGNCHCEVEPVFAPVA